MARQVKSARASGAKRRTSGVRASRKTDEAEGPSALDQVVGQRVRQRRNELGMSQETLGDAVGLTFQQIQKYERGANRIGASRLYEFSRFLKVPIGYFFETVPDAVREAAVARFAAAGVITDMGPETLKLVKLYYRIEDPNVRRRLYELVKAVSREED